MARRLNGIWGTSIAGTHRGFPYKNKADCRVSGASASLGLRAEALRAGGEEGVNLLHVRDRLGADFAQAERRDGVGEGSRLLGRLGAVGRLQEKRGGEHVARAIQALDRRLEPRKLALLA